MRQIRLSALHGAAALAIGLLSAQGAVVADATPATLTNASVRAGVSDYGTLGSNGTTPPGILYDASGTATYGSNDFLTPGTPFEGFYLTSSQGNWFSNNDGGDSFGTSSPTQLSATHVSWSATTSGGLTVTNDYQLDTTGGRSVIAITTTLLNNTGSDLSSLAFLRTLDPDPDMNNYSSYSTVNTLVGTDQACGTGSSSGQTICLYDAAGGFDGTVGISTGPWSTSPAAFLAGLNAGNGDNSLGLAYSLGTLVNGESLTLSYGYALGGSLGVATIPSAVPEPETWALVMAGLPLLGLSRRRRKA